MLTPFATASRTLPVSAVIPTKDRDGALSRTLDSLGRQSALPAELIVVDASAGELTRSVVDRFSERLGGDRSIRWIPAAIPGAAAQRNQGVAEATQPYIWFFDDDVLFEPECALRLWMALTSDPQLGGVNAMITNQSYQRPGFASRVMFRWMAGSPRASYAGCVIGPAINLLPEDRESLPEVVPVEWLNLTCTMYRRAALPDPPFPSVFVGYSFMEDVALSLTVGAIWRLANVRMARIHHDSQPGAHKANPEILAEMALFNRHYVMSSVLRRTRVADYFQLCLWSAFTHLAALRSVEGRRTWKSRLRGEWRAIRAIRRSGRSKK